MADALAELTGRLESVDDSGLSVLETAQLKALREACWALYVRTDEMHYHRLLSEQEETE